MKTKLESRKGFTLIELLVVMTIIAVLAGVGFTAFGRAQERARITTATQNLRANIYTAMYSYAGENNDQFPFYQRGTRNAHTTANDAFRELFISGILDDESVFEVGNSPAQVDGDIGVGPQFNRALEPGELHWEMAGPLTISTRSSTPLVWENSVTGSWNPQWDSGLAGNQVRGRTWSGGRIIILQVSGRVDTYQIDNLDGLGTLEGQGSGNRNLFQQNDAVTRIPDFSILRDPRI